MTPEHILAHPARVLSVAHLDPTPFPVPPDWRRRGYGSIFTEQKAGM